MGVQGANKVIARSELVGVAVFLVIGIVIALAPNKQAAERASAAAIG